MREKPTSLLKHRTSKTSEIMYFTPNNKVDDVTKAVVKAIKNRRFNFNRYLNAHNKFHGILLLCKEVGSEYIITVYNPTDGSVAHTVKTYKTTTDYIRVDDELYTICLQKDREEFEATRKATIEPLVEKITKHIQSVLDKMDSESANHIANLFEYIADPRRTAIGAAYSYNRGHFARIVRERLTAHGMRTDEGNGVYTMKQVCDMIYDGRM